MKQYKADISVANKRRNMSMLALLFLILLGWACNSVVILAILGSATSEFCMYFLYRHRPMVIGTSVGLVLYRNFRIFTREPRFIKHDEIENISTEKGNTTILLRSGEKYKIRVSLFNDEDREKLIDYLTEIIKPETRIASSNV